MSYATDPDEELEETGAHEWAMRGAEPHWLGKGECIAETVKAVLEAVHALMHHRSNIRLLYAFHTFLKLTYTMLLYYF